MRWLSQPGQTDRTELLGFILCHTQDGGMQVKNGRLCDVAPTLLDLMGMEKSKEMTGVSLVAG